MRSIKLFNGRGQWRRVNDKFVETGHVFIGAYSIADAMRALKEAGFIDVSRHEIEEYFAKGCWGNNMDGVARERGVWAMPFGQDYQQVKPIRYL